MLKEAPLQASYSGTHNFTGRYIQNLYFTRGKCLPTVTAEPNSHSHPIYAFYYHAGSRESNIFL